MEQENLQESLKRAIRIKTSLEDEIKMNWEKNKALLRQLFLEEIRIERITEKVALMKEAQREVEESEEKSEEQE